MERPAVVACGETWSKTSQLIVQKASEVLVWEDLKIKNEKGLSCQKLTFLILETNICTRRSLNSGHHFSHQIADSKRLLPWCQLHGLSLIWLPDKSKIGKKWPLNIFTDKTITSREGFCRIFGPVGYGLTRFHSATLLLTEWHLHCVGKTSLVNASFVVKWN